MKIIERGAPERISFRGCREAAAIPRSVCSLTRIQIDTIEWLIMSSGGGKVSGKTAGFV